MSKIKGRIGATITELRLSRKLTQSQLAEELDVSVETISRIERGVTFPSLRTIERIADALHVPIITLFECESELTIEQPYKRELSKLFGFLRTLDTKDIKLIHEILKTVYKKGV